MARRYTLAEIKRASKGHFFSKATMKFFKGDKYRASYDAETGINYVEVYHPTTGGRAVWKFIPETGDLKPVKIR